ncbi:Ankyrin repeat and KH domain-containing protein mask [Diplonema papillatum]|nr:Ankyrin repeat and KH domain-containing protein mask [Diplonema papillatum]KAJ9454211.1 Ankyrin repeat and KH domain-containing protein mask [Diplonema papillatum]
MKNRKGGPEPEIVIVAPEKPAKEAPGLSRLEALFQAVNAGDLPAAKELLNGKNVNHCDPVSGLSLVGAAAGRGDVEMTRLLISHGASLTVRDHEGFSPLHLAIWAGHLAIVQMLCEQGANVTAKGRNKSGSPLCLACFKGDLAILQFLLDFSKNAGIDEPDARGTTPLCCAAGIGSAPVVKLLLQRGADPCFNNPIGLCYEKLANIATRREQHNFESIIAMLSASSSEQSLASVR